MASFYFNSSLYRNSVDSTEYNNNNFNSSKNKKLSKAEKLQNREKQSLKLLYDMLGRLLETAENYALRDNEKKN